MIVDERQGNGATVTLHHEAETDTSIVTVIDESGLRYLEPRDRSEAVAMFYHPFAFFDRTAPDDLDASLAAAPTETRRTR